MKRLSLVDETGEYLLMKNPADYKGGFWFSYKCKNAILISKAIEDKTYSEVKRRQYRNTTELSFTHSLDKDSPMLDIRIRLWSYNAPFLQMQFAAMNLSGETLADFRIFNLMDFDIGGPKSYNNDVGEFQLSEKLMIVYDDTPLCVAMDSRPKPNAWEVSSPASLKVSESRLDLKKNTKLGPSDVTTGLQWNFGHLEPEHSAAVDVLIVAARKLDEAVSLVPLGWETVVGKMQ